MSFLLCLPLFLCSAYLRISSQNVDITDFSVSFFSFSSSLFSPHSNQIPMTTSPQTGLIILRWLILQQASLMTGMKMSQLRLKTWAQWNLRDGLIMWVNCADSLRLFEPIIWIGKLGFDWLFYIKNFCRGRIWSLPFIFCLTHVLRARLSFPAFCFLSFLPLLFLPLSVSDFPPLFSLLLIFSMSNRVQSGFPILMQWSQQIGMMKMMEIGNLPWLVCWVISRYYAFRSVRLFSDFVWFLFLLGLRAP